MIVVCGPSGAGKTTGIASFVSKNQNWKHLIASDILACQQRPTDNLSLIEAYENQKIINANLRRTMDDTCVILDGHLLVALQRGIFLVPPDTFANLTVSDIVFVSTRIVLNDVDEKKDSRVSDTGPIESAYAKWVSEFLDCRYHHIGGYGTEVWHEIFSALTCIKTSIEHKLR